MIVPVSRRMLDARWLYVGRRIGPWCVTTICRAPRYVIVEKRPS